MGVRTAWLILATVCFAGLSYGQTAPTADPNAGTAKDHKIRELIGLVGGPDLAVDVMKTQAASIKRMLPVSPPAQDEFEKEFIAAVKVQDLIELMVPIYDKHLSEADIDGMLTFYRSPAGRRVVKALPAIMTESQAVGMKWGQELGRKVGKKIAERVERGDYGSPPREH